MRNQDGFQKRNEKIIQDSGFQSSFNHKILRYKLGPNWGRFYDVSVSQARIKLELTLLKRKPSASTYFKTFYKVLSNMVTPHKLITGGRKTDKGIKF